MCFIIIEVFMPNQINSWQFVAECLQRLERVILIYVVESVGSSPGRAGFFMAVSESGSTSGSIGGGIMEHKFVEMALARMIAGDQQCSLHRQVHNKNVAKNQSGMICSGEQINIMYAVRQADFVAITTLLNNISNQQLGMLEISPNGIAILNQRIDNDGGLTLVNTNNWFYRERINLRNRLIIIGGGHCALALSKQMKLLNFTISIYEERSSLPTFAANDYVDEKVVVKSYADLAHLILPNINDYIVVMTVGYKTDDIAIRALKDKSFKYFGVLGSRKKIETMLTEYRTDNFSEAWLAALHAPAGLAINSHTPEEIAISISAEIVSVKNRIYKV